MKAWILGLALVAACTSPQPASEAQTAQASSPAASSPNYGDARSTATDAEVRDARRAYRSACQQSQSDDYCECMTGGMAQALSPAELSVATADLTGAQSSASAANRARVEAVRAQVDAGCAQFRRG